MSNESHDGLEGEQQQQNVHEMEIPVQEHVEEHTCEANENPSSSGPDSGQRGQQQQQQQEEPHAAKLRDPGAGQNRDVSSSSRQGRQRKEVSEGERQRREERRRRENERRLEGQRREFERKREARKKAAEEEEAARTRARAQTQSEDGDGGEPQRRTENEEEEEEEEEEEASPGVQPEQRRQGSRSPGTVGEIKPRVKKKKKKAKGGKRKAGSAVTKVDDQKEKMDAENVAAAESGVLEHDAGAARLTIAEEEKEHSKSLAIAHSLFKPTSVVSSGYAPPSPPITPRDSTCPPLGYGYDDREDCGLLCDMEDWQTSMESDYLFEAPLLRWLTVPVLTPLLEEGEGAQTRQDATDLLFLEPSLGRSPEGGPPSSSDGIDIPKVKICHAAAPTHIHHHSRNGGVSVVSGEMREPEPAQRAQRGRNRSRGRGPRWYGRGGRRSS